MDINDLKIFIEKFRDDSHNLLNDLEEKLLELEKNTGNQELIEAVFRAMHTLKGVGAMYGFNTISEYTHLLEGIYDKIREGMLDLSKDIFNVTLTSVDHIRNLLTEQELKNPVVIAQHKNLVSTIEQILAEKNQQLSKFSVSGEKVRKKKKSDLNSWYIQFVCSEELIYRCINIIFIFQDLAKLGTYKMSKLSAPVMTEDGNYEETWGIILSTESGYDEIEEVFIFITEFVKIIKAADQDLLDADILNQLNCEEVPEKQSIYDIAQKLGESIEEGGTIKQESPSDNQTDKTPAKQLNNISRISVRSDKLDKLMFLVSELFTTKSELQIASNKGDLNHVKTAVEKIEKLAGQFRNNALSIRLVPLKELTLKFKRLIRDLSQQLNKKIEFDIQGDDTELDKNLVDNLADSFMHLIRNCIDHGIESPEIRLKKGKPEFGAIRFSAFQSGNFIFIQISDDGNGIDVDYIKSKAIEKGFIQANTQLSERELLDLIFLPGFSTAESLTQISGRGVGMDVVKRSITDLRGSVEVETEKGQGTSFTIKLQQTISIMDTLLIKVENTFFTIILEEVEICGLEKHEVLFSKNNSHWQLENELIPFVYLREAFKLKGTPPSSEKIVVVRKQSKRYAIVADDIIGQYQAVLKPIGQIFKNQEYISGASVMGDGNIALMLDTNKLSSYKENKVIANHAAQI